MARARTRVRERARARARRPRLCKLWSKWPARTVDVLLKHAQDAEGTLDQALEFHFTYEDMTPYALTFDKTSFGPFLFTLRCAKTFADFRGGRRGL